MKVPNHRLDPGQPGARRPRAAAAGRSPAGRPLPVSPSPSPLTMPAEPPRAKRPSPRCLFQGVRPAPPLPASGPGGGGIRKTFPFVLPQGRRMRRRRKAGWRGESAAPGRSWWTRLKTIKAKDKSPSSPAETPPSSRKPSSGRRSPSPNPAELCWTQPRKEAAAPAQPSSWQRPRLSTRRWPFPSRAPAGGAPPALTHCRRRSPGRFLPRQGGCSSSSSRRRRRRSRSAGWE